MRKLLLIFSLVTLLIVTPVFAADINVQVNSPEASINFRTYPSTSSPIIMGIPNGVVLHVTGLSYNSADDLIFGQTYYNGSNGWISLRQTTINNFTGFNTTVSSTGGSINFRASASTSSNVICEIPNGTSLYISDIYYNSADDLFFGMTTYNGITGWVSLRQTTLDTSSATAPSTTANQSLPGPGGTPGLSIRTDVGFNGIAQVMSEQGGTYFRTLPSTSSDVICELPNHERLTIYDIVRNEDLVWGYVECNGRYGWVSLRHTVTPMHEYAMPDHIRQWDGTIHG